MKKLVILFVLTFFLFSCGGTDDDSGGDWDFNIDLGDCWYVRVFTKNCLGEYQTYWVTENEADRLRELVRNNSGCFPVEVESFLDGLIEGFLDSDSEIYPLFYESCG